MTIVSLTEKLQNLGERALDMDGVDFRVVSGHPHADTPVKNLVEDAVAMADVLKIDVDEVTNMDVKIFRILTHTTPDEYEQMIDQAGFEDDGPYIQGVCSLLYRASKEL